MILNIKENFLWEKQSKEVIPPPDKTLTKSGVAADAKAVGDSFTANFTASDGLQFKFGKDGDGNYGYYGTDGSLVPFRCYYKVPYATLSANLKNGSMTTNQYDGSYGFSCSGTVSKVSSASYCGTKFTMDITNYDTLYFAYRKEKDHGQLTAVIYKTDGTMEQALTNSYHTNSTTWSMYKIDLSGIKGTRTILLHGGYVDSTGSSSSLSYFSCIYLSRGGTPPSNSWV